eukprot:15313686-Heterocapsa_arctica.AAC.1
MGYNGYKGYRELPEQDTLSERLRAAPDSGARHDGIWSRRQRENHDVSEHGIPHGSSDICEGQILPRNARTGWALDRGYRAPGFQEGASEAST